MNAIRDLANKALAEGRFTDAAPLLEKLLSHAPANAELLRALALVHTALENWSRARDYAGRLVALGRGEHFPLGAHLLLDSLRMENDESGIARAWPAVRLVFSEIIANDADITTRDQIFSHAAEATIQAGDAELGAALLQWRFRKSVGVGLTASISPVATLQDWCKLTQTPYMVIAPPGHYRLRNGAIQTDYHSSVFGYAVIPRGEILSGWRYPRTATQHILGYPPTVKMTLGNWFPQVMSTVHPRALHLWPEEVVEIDEDVLHLNAPPHFHSGHWINDFLPRIRALAEPELQGFKIAIPRELPQKNRDFLALFGVTNDDLIECTLGTRYRFRRLLEVDPGYAHTPSPEITRYLVDCMRPQFPDAEPSRRLFIVRSMSTRQIANMPDVEKVLEQHAFECIDLAQAPVTEQQLRLGTADIAVGVYGSDLLGMLFMQEGSDFIELRYDDNGCCIHNMHSVVKVNYHVLQCQPLAAGYQVRMKKDKDFVVDCRQLDALLRSIISRKASGERFQTPMSIEPL